MPQIIAVVLECDEFALSAPLSTWHGMWSKLFNGLSPEGNPFHGSEKSGISAGIAGSMRNFASGKHEMRWEFGFLDDSLGSAFLMKLRDEEPEFILSRNPLKLRRKPFRRRDRFGSVSFADLCCLADEFASTKQAVDLQFVSPMQFRRSGRRSLSVEPDRLFDSVLNKCERFLPTEAGKFISNLDARKLRIDDIDLKGVEIKYRPDLTEKGVVGKIRIIADRKEDRQGMHFLALMAVYSGIGAKTAMGMGKVDLKI